MVKFWDSKMKLLGGIFSGLGILLIVFQNATTGSISADSDLGKFILNAQTTLANRLADTDFTQLYELKKYDAPSTPLEVKVEYSVHEILGSTVTTKLKTASGSEITMGFLTGNTLSLDGKMVNIGMASVVDVFRKDFGVSKLNMQTLLALNPSVEKIHTALAYDNQAIYVKSLAERIAADVKLTSPNMKSLSKQLSEYVNNGTDVKLPEVKEIISKTLTVVDNLKSNSENAKIISPYELEALKTTPAFKVRVSVGFDKIDEFLPATADVPIQLTTSRSAPVSESQKKEYQQIISDMKDKKVISISLTNQTPEVLTKAVDQIQSAENAIRKISFNTDTNPPPAGSSPVERMNLPTVSGMRALKATAIEYSNDLGDFVTKNKVRGLAAIDAAGVLASIGAVDRIVSNPNASLGEISQAMNKLVNNTAETASSIALFAVGSKVAIVLASGTAAAPAVTGGVAAVVLYATYAQLSDPNFYKNAANFFKELPTSTAVIGNAIFIGFDKAAYNLTNLDNWIKNALSIEGFIKGALSSVLENALRKGSFAFRPEIVGELSKLYWAAEACNIGDCVWSNRVIKNGGTTAAFLTQSVPFGQTCVRMDRLCTNGVLSGYGDYASCRPAPPEPCKFGNGLVSHGSTTPAYEKSIVKVDEKCVPTYRTCNNGVLSGTGNFRTCEQAKGKSCLFGNWRLEHGNGINSYAASEVPFGKQCVPIRRTCTDGTLSEGGTWYTCRPADPAPCSFGSKIIAHGSSVTAYSTKTVPYGSKCEGRTRTCNNGNLNGIGEYDYCERVRGKKCLLNGQTLLDGQGVWTYSSLSQPCVSSYRICSNGSMSAGGEYFTCHDSSLLTKSCILNNGSIINNYYGTSYTQGLVPYGGTCQPVASPCKDGSLTVGGTGFRNCVHDYGKDCKIGNRILRHGNSLYTYATQSVPFGQTCKGQWISCNDGKLSGPESYLSCQPEKGRSCQFVNNMIPNGGAVIAYPSQGVPFGETCVRSIRHCKDGVLDGEGYFSNCRVAQGKSCSIGNQRVPHLGSITTYETQSVPFGEKCVPLTRKCTDGLLSEGGNFTSCAPKIGADCNFGNNTIKHLTNVYAYEKSCVASGESQNAEWRICTDGSLSGSNRFFNSLQITNPPQ